MSRLLDAIDRRIVTELQSDGRLTIVELAARVHLTKTPCAERLRRLEREGIVTGYRATVSAERLGRGHLTIVHVNLNRTDNTALDAFNRAVREIPEVDTCLMIAGPFDYMLKVRTRDMAHYRHVIGDRITSLPGVQQTHSFAVMETVCDSPTVPVDEQSAMTVRR